MRIMERSPDESDISVNRRGCPNRCPIPCHCGLVGSSSLCLHTPPGQRSLLDELWEIYRARIFGLPRYLFHFLLAILRTRAIECRLLVTL